MEQKRLIIAEKPSAARAIAEALGGFARREGYLESSDYYVSWALGHLVELLSPEEYDSRWKRWSLETLPILPPTFGLKVATKTRSQFNILATLARRASLIINACDAAREGELIFRYILQAAGVDRPVQRLWVSALTQDAIRRAFANLRAQGEYDRLYQSALCRSQGDWLVGINATRAFTVKWGELFSVGRVQTPTLSLLVRREREITAFASERYWQVEATFALPGKASYKGRWFGEQGDRLTTQQAADEIAARVDRKAAVIESVTETETRDRPPQLFDLTSLQREANRRFGMTAAATLKAAQALYERKLITYPRTDSRYLNQDLLSGLPSVLRSLAAQPALGTIARQADLKRVHPGNRRVVDDAKVTDHHAIIPTSEAAGGLSGVEGKIYDLIARRFLAQLFPDAEWLETEVITRVDPVPDRFRTKGRQLVAQGWRLVEPEPASRKGTDEEAEAPLLPSLHQGTPAAVRSSQVLQKETQPPKRYTEAALLAAMESAGKAMDDESLKEAMKGRGLGTPATRAAIIERLKDVGYIAAEQKVLVPTEKGHRLVQLAEEIGAQVLLSPEMTGEWEKRLADIHRGEEDPALLMADIRAMASSIVELTRTATAPGLASTATRASARSRASAHGRASARGPSDAPAQSRADGPAPGLVGELAATAGAAAEGPITAGRCPRCGRSVIRGSRMWACANSECGLQCPTWLCGKVIDGPLIQSLLEKGRTKLITGFKSPRTGKTFSAYLVWQSGKVGFEFPADKPRKQSSQRRGGAGGSSGERSGPAKTGPRTAGSGAGKPPAAARKRSPRMGGGTPGPS